MSIQYALSEIEQMTNGKLERIAPGTVFTLSDSKNLKSLTALRAIREPSESEIALYEKQLTARAQRSVPAAGDAPAKTKAAGKGRRKDTDI